MVSDFAVHSNGSSIMLLLRSLSAFDAAIPTSERPVLTMLTGTLLTNQDAALPCHRADRSFPARIQFMEKNRQGPNGNSRGVGHQGLIINSIIRFFRPCADVTRGCGWADFDTAFDRHSFCD